MNYQLRKKSWAWKLTGSFASNNYTTIGDTIYFPEGRPPSSKILEHELIHIKQQQEVGLVKYLFLYLFALPFGWNPWRYKWEFEAYTEGSGMTEEHARSILHSSSYGWLKLNQ